MVPGSAAPPPATCDTDITRIKTKSQLCKGVLRKLDLRLLPVVTAVYFLSVLDRSNIGNARVAGLERDLGLTEKQYKICVTIFFIPYLLSELPSNLILKVVGPRRLLPTLLSLWGAVTCIQGLVTNFWGLLATRFFLGLFEGPMLPGIILYLSGFYTRRELGLRLAYFFSAMSLAGAFSGFLAAAISKMDGIGGKRGWAWIFILEGLLSVVVGFACFFLIPSTLEDARFLTAEEREVVLNRLEQDRPAILTSAGFQWKEVAGTLLSPHVLILAMIFFFNGAVLFGLAIFIPSIIKSLGFSPIKSQLLSVGPFATGFFVALFSSLISDRYNVRAIPIIISAILSATGFIIFLSTTRTFVLYGSLFLAVSGAYSISPISSAWASNNSEPHYRRATAIALVAVLTNGAGIVSTWSFPDSAAPRYTGTIIMNLTCAIMVGVLSAINGLLLHRKNKQKEDPVQRQKMISPYCESEGHWDHESGHKCGEEADKRAWLVLGDKHPDFKYVI
ncbi:MFS general substrate transporter [Macrolepiota fuliginosa MF-IS2]|uniref:MFS general substrate transporter n=1 Tax=Macrolepiota fuliginosa MF-IS2 TaxID=1400762 RepID=A0A9P6C150_9AGAR|nr:MFS general substrate transporter [Macrolepiota fuliginosa MF-IS2]